MGRTYAIALNAYREAIRDRVLLGVLALAALSLVLGSSLAWLSLAEQVRILVDHGIVTLSWLSNLVAIFLGASFLYKEIELRTLYVILAKPVARWQFMLGKYLGILATVIAFIAFTAALLLVLLDLQTAEARGPTGAGVWLAHQVTSSRRARIALIVGGGVAVLVTSHITRRVKWFARIREGLGAARTVVLALSLLAVSAAIARAVAPEETRYILASACLVLSEVVIVAAVAVMFSSFSTPFVTGLLTFGVFLVGRSAGAMLELKSRQLPGGLRMLLRGVATVAPNLQLYVPSRDALQVRETGISVTAYLGETFGYAALYASVLLVIAALLFRRRDLV